LSGPGRWWDTFLEPATSVALFSSFFFAEDPRSQAHRHDTLEHTTKKQIL
jgi:hypothetical protein